MTYTALRQQLIDALLSEQGGDGAFPVRRVVTEIDSPAPWEDAARSDLAALWGLSEYQTARQSHVVVTCSGIRHDRRGVGGREVERYDFLVEVYTHQEAGTDSEGRFLEALGWTLYRMRQMMLTRWAGAAWQSFEPATATGPTLVEYRGFRCHYCALRFPVEALADT